jgi:hypothetical protein
MVVFVEPRHALALRYLCLFDTDHKYKKNDNHKASSLHYFNAENVCNFTPKAAHAAH